MTTAGFQGKRGVLAKNKVDVVNQIQIMMRTLVTLTNTLTPLPDDRW
jgi:hypothetical protein